MKKKLKIFKVLKNSLRDMKFQQKISIIVFISIFLPCTVMSFLTYNGAVDALTKQTISIVKSHTSSSIENIDNSLSAAVSINGHILNEDKVIEYAKNQNIFTAEEKSKYYPELYRIFNSYISRIKAPNILSGLHSYYLYLPIQNTVITTDTTYYEKVTEDNLDFVKKLVENEYSSGWYATIPVTYDTLSGKTTDQKFISYIMPIYNNENNTLAAVCSLNISTELFDDLYENPVKGVNNSTYILGTDGIIIDENNGLTGISSEQKTELLNSYFEKYPKSEFEIQIKKSKYYGVFGTSNFAGLRYITLFNENDISNQLTGTRLLLVTMIPVSLMLILFFSLLLARLFQTPLKKLIYAMEQVQNGNLDTHISDKRRDEYELIYSVFNSMTDELDRLVKNLGTEQMLNKEAKIKLLQEQINPHFLYNTLDSIYSIAKLQNVPEISNMVLALSKFFRAGLSEGKDIVPLSNAIGLVESYLTVQNIRFNGKVQFKVDASGELLDCLVPKLILQPFVENSVYHGIEKKKEEGLLYVKAEEIENCLYLRVSDNGIGIPEDKLIQIREALKDNFFSKDGNFAIKNLNSQIKLRFGSQYGISIDSTEGIGTKVLIKLPAIRTRGELQEKSILPIQN